MPGGDKVAGSLDSLAHTYIVNANHYTKTVPPNISVVGRGLRSMSEGEWTNTIYSITTAMMSHEEVEGIHFGSRMLPVL